MMIIVNRIRIAITFVVNAVAKAYNGSLAIGKTAMTVDIMACRK